jgi:hypothetical protein
VTGANSGTARKNANHSRRAGLRSCGSDRDRRRSWKRPFRRTVRAIKSTFRLIDSSLRVIEASERLATGRPVQATRQLQLVVGWLAEAASELECATRGLRSTLDHAALSPELALDAPRMLVDAAKDWMDAALQLAALSDRFDDTFGWLVDSVKSGAIPIPPEEQMSDDGKPVTTLRLTPARRLPDWFGYQRYVTPCIPDRQRSARVTVVEAVRRISRGRAPPSVSTCSL